MRTRAGEPERGQAMTEALLLMLPLMMIVAAMLQIFLVDEHAFRLATRANQRLFGAVAFPGNRPGVSYDTPTVAWDGPERYVPVIGFFAPFGLTREQMRIRTVRPSGGDKLMMIGRGTAPSLANGLAGSAAWAPLWLAAVDQHMIQLSLARDLSKKTPPSGIKER